MCVGGLPAYRRRVASWRSTWWSDLGQFAKDAARADDERLLDMYRWAVDHESRSGARGPGHNPKSRTLFNSMTRVAAVEIERRGLAYWRRWPSHEQAIEPFDPRLGATP